MKSAARSFLIAALVFISPTAAQDTNEGTRTTVEVDNIGYAVSNGKVWGNLDNQNRIIYLMGLEEGTRLVLLDATRHETPKAKGPIKRATLRLAISGFRFSDIVQQVNKFYSDSANLRIPVIEAYSYSIDRMKGALPQKLSDREAELRVTYNK